jgi:hypothetical protein
MPLSKKKLGMTILGAFTLWIVGFMIWVVYISFTPDVKPIAQIIEDANIENHEKLTGDATISSLIFVSSTLLEKSGGYTSNDLMVKYFNFFDNMPNWEKGALFQIRDLTRATRDEFSRSQSTSAEDIHLKEGEPKFSFDNDSWNPMASSESKYQDGVVHLKAYLDAISDPINPSAQFYARADNLVSYLSLIEKRLGSLSQNLSDSVGSIKENTDLANDANAEQSTYTSTLSAKKIPYAEVDDYYWQARGSVWALIHFFKGIEIDFNKVLVDKNAVISVKQIIRELESANESLSSPVILNGSGTGFLANHSLTMANYISRANAAIIELKKLIENG